MIVPTQLYTKKVFFDTGRNRWVAKFSSENPEGISFPFPLPDVPINGYDHNRMEQMERPGITSAEERLLALVFSQMVETALDSAAKLQAEKYLQAMQQNHQTPQQADGITLTE